MRLFELDLKNIQPPSDDVHTVANSNFTNYEIVGNAVMDIDDLGGGVSSDHKDRVEELARQISSPEGYFSRLIVEPDGNVIEGQHRLDALRLLNVEQVPVFVIRDKLSNLPELEMLDAIENAGSIHHDHKYQVMDQLSDMLSDVGSPQAVIDEYDFPKGFEKFFIAALEVIK